MPDEKKKDAPLKDPKVKVDVEPGTDMQPGEGRELEKKIRKQVQKAIEEKKGGGHKEQLDAAEEAAQEAIRRVNPRKAADVDVEVSGEDPDGNKRLRGVSGKPKGDS